MPQPLLENIITHRPAPTNPRSYSPGGDYPIQRVSATKSILFRTSPNRLPYLVPTQPHCPEDFRTKSTGEGSTLPHPGPFTSNLEPNTSNLPSIPLPLSTVLSDNKGGCAWPDRTSFRKKIQDGQQGPKALCRGVSGGRTFFVFLQNKLLASRGGWPIPKYRRTKQCAKLSPSNAPPARTGTTPPPRTRRRPPAASSSQSSATPAASIRHTKRRSKSTLGIRRSA